MEAVGTYGQELYAHQLTRPNGAGHGCWTARPNDEGSPDVFVNRRPAHRAQDHWQTHLCPDIPEFHDSVLAQGSASVFVNARALGRIGDPVACGSKIATGSENVYAGG